MNDKLDYPGKELEIFDKAVFWRKYLFSKIKKFLGKEILEVGAGMGSFTKTYLNRNKFLWSLVFQTHLNLEVSL